MHGLLGLGVSGEFFHRKTYYQDGVSAPTCITRSSAHISRGEWDREPAPPQDVATGHRAGVPASRSCERTDGTGPRNVDRRRRYVDDNAGGVRIRLRYREPVFPHGTCSPFGHRVNPRTDAGVESDGPPDVRRRRGHPIDLYRRRGPIQALGVEGILDKGRYGDGVRAELGLRLQRRRVSPALHVKSTRSHVLRWVDLPAYTRVGVQIFRAQHVATLGDLTTSAQTYENVIANFWSVGDALVFR